MINRICAFRINDEFIKCGRDGRPLKSKRAKARVMEEGEKEAEKKFLKKSGIEQFDPKNCSAYNFMAKMLSSRCVNWNNARGFAELMSIVLNIEFTRESYRRFGTCMLWIDTNFDSIMDYISKNKVEVILYSGKIRKLTPLTKDASKQKPDNSDKQSDILKEKNNDDGLIGYFDDIEKDTTENHDTFYIWDVI